MSLPIPDYFAHLADGPNAMGFSTVRATSPWDWFFNSTDASRWYHNISPRAAANQTGGMLIHNPGGRASPMSIAEFNESSAQNFIFGNTNPNLKAATDWNAFIEAAGKYKTNSNLWLGMYVGGGEMHNPARNRTTLPVLRNESPEHWATRAEVAISPILLIRPQVDAIFFDATFGRTNEFDQNLRVVTGVNGGIDILIRRLQKRGYQIGTEGSCFKHATWLHSCTCALTDTALNNGERSGWMSRDNDGVLKPRLRPHEMTGRPLLISRYLRDMKRNGKTDSAIWAEVDSINEAGYSAAMKPYNHTWPETLKP